MGANGVSHSCKLLQYLYSFSVSASILVNSSLEHLLISPEVMNIIFVLTCSGGATGFNSPAQRPFRRLLRYTRASGHSCARSRPSSCRPSSAVTLRSPQRYYRFFCFALIPSDIKNDTLSGSQAWKTEGLRRSSRILSLACSVRPQTR